MTPIGLILYVMMHPVNMDTSFVDKYMSTEQVNKLDIDTAIYFVEFFRIIRIDYDRVWEDDETHTFIYRTYYVNGHNALVSADDYTSKKMWVWGVKAYVMCFVSGKPKLKLRISKLFLVDIVGLASGYLDQLNWHDDSASSRHRITTHLYDSQKHKGMLP